MGINDRSVAVDLAALLAEVREATLVAAAFTRYAGAMLRKEGWTQRTRRLVRKAEQAARAAMFETRAAHEAISVAGEGGRGDPS